MITEAILARFAFASPPQSWAAFGNGHINDTIRVRCADGDYIAQRINGSIFRQPLAVMGNIVRVLDHLARHEPNPRRRLQLVPTREGAGWWQESNGDVWRVYPFMSGTVTIEQVSEPLQAYAAAQAFAQFLARLADLPGEPLATVIPGFHDTPARLAQLAEAAQADSCGRLAGVAEEVRWSLAQGDLAALLVRACARGELVETATHNDTKIGNLLMEPDGRTAACVIDLDTMMPGLVLNDFADLVRSATCRGAEDGDPRDMHADPHLLAALVEGWLAGRGNAASAAERALMPAAGAVITFEQGIRFLTDHLRGDPYYRIHRPEHNRDRALAQLTLARDLIARRADIARLVG